MCHTLNLRLHPDDVAFIAEDAKDRFLLLDETLVPLCDKFQRKDLFERIFVVNATGPVAAPREDYEKFLASAPAEVKLPALAESDALGCCYTSGTTGKPKGVVYTHKSTLLHALVTALPDSLDLARATRSCPWCRCSTSTPGACPSRAP